MKAPLFGRIAILGTGLIGASLAAAIRKHHLALHVAAHDSSAQEREVIAASHCVDTLHETAAEAVRDADLILLAVPPVKLASLVASISGAVKSGAIVTDVTSVKRFAITSIKPQLPHDVHFVPGHPIAGSEKRGASAADAALFNGRKVILTPSEAEVLSEPVNQVRALWQELGAQVECMPPELHDRIYAYVSHLPQLLAFAAKAQVNASHPTCAGVTRLSASDIPLWTEICFANADFIHEALDEFCTLMGQMRHELAEHGEESPVTSTEEDLSPLLCAVIGLCLVATALLLEQHTGIHTSRYGGKGFTDMTAAAGNQSDSVLAAISSQPFAVAHLLENTLNRLHGIGAALATGKQELLAAALRPDA